MLLPITAGVGTLVVAGYNTMSPTSQLYGRTFIGEGRGSKRLALTFDDGPNDPHTLHLLDVLAKHNVKATFFVIGKYVRQRADIVRAVAESGHVVANHTFSHPNLIFRSADDTRREIAECEAAIRDAIGEHSALFRPPHGGRRPANLRAIRAMGYEPIMWSATGFDWSATSAQKIVDKISHRIRGGEVILLHDGGHLRMGTDRRFTVAATDQIISRYKNEGYEFVTVTDMVEKASGVRFQASGSSRNQPPEA